MNSRLRSPVQAREVYRPVATRGSLVYFLIDNLNALDRIYHYSMANFVFVLKKGMDVTPGGRDESRVPEAERLGLEAELDKRVELLIETTCYSVFAYVAQGLFERHKLIVATQLCMSILKGRGELQFLKFDFLLRGPKVMGVDNPLADWVSDSVWGSVQVSGGPTAGRRADRSKASRWTHSGVLVLWPSFFLPARELDVLVSSKCEEWVWGGVHLVCSRAWLDGRSSLGSLRS